MLPSQDKLVIVEVKVFHVDIFTDMAFLQLHIEKELWDKRTARMLAHNIA
jgi:hypothetical protein